MVEFGKDKGLMWEWGGGAWAGSLRRLGPRSLGGWVHHLLLLGAVTVGLPILSRVSSEMRLQILDAATT